MILSQLIGHGGVISKLLKAKVMIPLSRLSFGVYLVHLSVIYMKNYSTRHTFFWNDYQLFNSAFGTFIISVMLAYFLYIMFESPVVRLEKQFMTNPKNDLTRNTTPSSTCSKSSGLSSYYCHCKDSLKNQCSFTNIGGCKKSVIVIQGGGQLRNGRVQSPLYQSHL